eukprot:9618273-Lingulodinium_polyedra.AAC.1
MHLKLKSYRDADLDNGKMERGAELADRVRNEASELTTAVKTIKDNLHTMRQFIMNFDKI